MFFYCVLLFGLTFLKYSKTHFMYFRLTLNPDNDVDTPSDSLVMQVFKITMLFTSRRHRPSSCK